MFQSTLVFSQGVETFHHWFFAQLLLNVPTLRLLAPSTSINQIIVGSYSHVLLVHIPHFFRSHSRRSPFFNSRSNLEIHRCDGDFLQGLPSMAPLAAGISGNVLGLWLGLTGESIVLPEKNNNIGFYFFFFPRFVSSKKRMFPCFSTFLLFPASLLLENKRFAIQHVANTVEVAASSSKMLQIARKTNRRGNARKSKRTITLLVIPTVTKFCHSFRHLIWKYIWHIFSDILTFYSGTLSGIYSILTFSLTVALPDLDLAVEVQQCPLRSGAREEGGEKEEGGRKEGGRRKEVTLIKSRDPHLVWGKTKTEKTHQTIPDLFTFLCFWGCHQTIPNTWTAEAAAQR